MFLNYTDRGLISRRLGFTTYELATVIGILLGLVGMAGVSVMDYLRDEKIDRAQTECRHLARYCEQFANRYPNTPLRSLDDLEQIPPGDPPLLPMSLRSLRDPWGVPYRLTFGDERSGFRFQVSTTTPEGIVLSN